MGLVSVWGNRNTKSVGEPYMDITTVLAAFDTPIPLFLQYVKGGGATSYFPVSAITDRLDARNQLKLLPPTERPME